ncbi:MAG: hypothetical protein DCC75_01065 [Proteobacteria bacterium]|nr:MAG: hypothetical protein DCC75_01065 [Pseudomonadota bacterium]
MNLFYPFSAFSFAHEYLLLAPLIVLLLLRLPQRRGLAVPHPQVETLRKSPLQLKAILRKFLLGVFGTFFVVFLSLAAARPQKVLPQARPRESRNLMLAIDVSPSMGTADFASGAARLSRIRAVKQVLSEFIRARGDDSIGLVIFGGNAFLQCPLTSDHKILSDFIGRLEVGMAGDGTAIGDGLGVSLKRIQEIRSDAKAIILLTDGVSNAGQVNPIKAAKVAADLGIKVHTIGIGSTGQVTMNIPGGFLSRQVLASAEYDEDTLKEVAKLTGGVFFNAADMAGLSNVYQEIDKLERTKQDQFANAIYQDLFAGFAWLALLSYLIIVLTGHSVLMKIP